MRTLVALIAVTIVLAGCNTIAGVGKDVEAAGRAIDRTATETKRRM